MITYENLSTYCPQCNHTLYRGTLDFGPSAVECKKCGAHVSTGLSDWEELSIFEKIGYSLKECFAPSFLSMDAAGLRCILNFFIWCMSVIPIALIVTIPEINNIMKNSEKNEILYILINIVLFLAFLWYPALLVYRILKLRKQSIYYNKNGQLPKW